MIKRGDLSAVARRAKEEKNITLENIEKIAKALNKNIRDLF